MLGRSDPDLDELGELQAAAVAGAMGRVDRVLSSPLLRARRTAEAFGLTVEVDERWVEMDYGELDGVPVSDVPAEVWSRWRSDLDWAPEGGESHATMGMRVRSACVEAFEAAATCEVVVVTHVSPIKAALAWSLGVGDEIAWRCHVMPAAVMRIAGGRLGPSVRSFNDVSHLSGIGP